MVVLNINCFDSKQRFIDSLREVYGGGSFLLGPDVTGTIVQLYCQYLKDNFGNQAVKKKIYKTEFMGYHGDKYWLVSHNVSVSKCN